MFLDEPSTVVVASRRPEVLGHDPWPRTQAQVSGPCPSSAQSLASARSAAVPMMAQACARTEVEVRI